MAGYFITSYDVTNPEGLGEYRKLVGPTLAKHRANVLVSGRGTELEGTARQVTIVLEFPSVEAAHAWYDDPDYQAILAGRLDNSSGGTAIIVDGFTPPAPA